jgi:hypothetical protein
MRGGERRILQLFAHRHGDVVRKHFSPRSNCWPLSAAIILSEAKRSRRTSSLSALGLPEKLEDPSTSLRMTKQERVVIPRLAQRAEGPHKRCGVTQTSTNEFATPICVHRASGRG